MYKKVLAVTIMFLASVFLTMGIGVSHAAEKKETAKGKTAQSAETKKVFDAHDTGVRYHFNDTDMDFNFGTLVLGSAVNHGVEIGEAFYVASKIKDGDAASWQEEWFKMAVLAEAPIVSTITIRLLNPGSVRSSSTLLKCVILSRSPSSM